MTSRVSEYDWKKAAAQTVDNNSVERAFMDQAYQQMANKAAPLMKDPHRLGFEVVDKNEQNTKMIGLFAFRVGDSLLYIPVFFLNGEIKGTDMIYRHDIKKFVPNNEDWIKYIINKYTRDIGYSVDKKVSNRSPKSINLEDLAYPPNTVKSASAKEVVDSLSAGGELIKRFILEDGGMESIEKLASWMEQSVDFTNGLVTLIPEECWMPAELGQKLAEKSAAENKAPVPTLVLNIGGIQNIKGIPADHLEKSASNMQKKGYDLWDDRKSNMAEVYEDDATATMSEVSAPGVYDVILADGSTGEAFCAPVSSVYLDGISSYGGTSACPASPCGYPDWERRNKRINVIFKDSKGSQIVCNGVFGNQKKDLHECVTEGEGMLQDSMSSGKVYVIFDPEEGAVSDPIYCRSSETTSDGIKIYKVNREYGSPMTLRQNPDLQENMLDKGILGRDAFFVSVAFEKRPESDSCCGGSDYSNSFDVKPGDYVVGGPAQLRDWVLGDSKIKKASIYHSDGNFSLRHGFGNQTEYLPRVDMAVKLATDLRIRATAADELLDKSASDKEVNFFYSVPDLEKSAASRTIFPKLNRSSYSEYGVRSDPDQTIILEEDTQGAEGPRQRMGDGFDPGMGMGPQEDGDGLPKEVIFNTPPEQLAQMASQSESGNIFEHGLVGSLVQTFDAISTVDRYIPELEDALDKLGRILFLFYWKPRDFEEAYGKDDMSNMENQIISNFKSFGEMVLDLVKKADKRKRGIGSIIGE